MPLPKVQVFNTLSSKKEEFKSIEKGKASIYSCGPTVYSYTHVGNARAALTADFVVKVFRLAGYETHFQSNITDVDDKIIKAANEAGKSSDDIAKQFEKEYLKELSSLCVDSVDQRPRATEHIPEMVSLIEALIAKGKAYVAETPFGSDVYFRVLEFKEYGKLSKRKTDDLISGARIEPGEMKENPLDFALWKAAKEGEPSWDSPWGKGRPGWHTECCAMVDKNFPKGIDIHMGGLDLIFPHHENEIAQSESLDESKPFAPYWIHCGMLTIEREKMSKSIGNVFLTKDFLKQYGPETLRMLLLQHHYRSPIDFSEESILRSEALVERLYHAQEILDEKKIESSSTESPLAEQMKQALFDDFNSAKALGFLFKKLREAFKDDESTAWSEVSSGLTLLKDVFSLVKQDAKEAQKTMQSRRFERSGKDSNYCESVEHRLSERKRLRGEKDFEAADNIRKELEAEGVIIMDGPDGTAWRL